MRHRSLAALPLVFCPLIAQADGCAHERGLNAAESQFVKSRNAAAESAYPAPPAGWTRYAPDAGLDTRVRGGSLPAGLCDDYGPHPLRWSVAATYTPQDSALMKDLGWQRAERERKKKTEDLQQKMQAAAQRGDFEAMQKYSQEMQAASRPTGAAAATPLSDEELQKRSDALNARLEQAQKKNDYAAMQAITAEQMSLMMRQAGVDTSGVASATPTSEQINAAPRVHVVVEFNADSYTLQENSKPISYGGARGGFLYRHNGWCFADGGPAEKTQADLLFGAWQPATDYANRPSGFTSQSALKGANTSVATVLVTVCGDPATVEKLLPAIKYDALK